MKTTIYWSRAALGLAERQTRDMSESKANEILRHRGSYRNPSGEDFFPFPAPEPSTDFLEKFPDLANMPRDSNAKLKLLLSRAKEYEIILIKLANAGEISFYDPATLLRISNAGDIIDPIVDMDKIAAQIIQYSETNCTFSAVRPLSTPQALPASEPVMPAVVLLEQTDDVGLSKREKQIRAIEAAAAAKGYDTLNIPTGGKKFLRAQCQKSNPKLFGVSPHPFDDAWKMAITCYPPRLRIADHRKFSGK